SLYNLSRTKW
ncbi:DEAD/DEAH box helicase family protein, partial [Vibrio parahaemolyticus V-223/04]